MVGKPGDRFLNQILLEVVEISKVLWWKQRYTTSNYTSWTRAAIEKFRD
jgi:hypothetical protein